MSEIALNEVISAIEGGQSVRQFCRERHVSAPWIYRRLKAAGYVLERRHLWSSTLEMGSDPGVLGYVAGIIDGEGSILRTNTGHWQVKVGMTDEPVMRWLHALGGTLAYQSREREVNRRPVWTWQVSRRRDVVVLLQALMPYLIVKQEKAELALAWGLSDERGTH
jgi:hypothetical protein